MASKNDHQDKQRVLDLLSKLTALFIWDGEDPGRTGLAEHRMGARDIDPISLPPGRMTKHCQTEVRQIIRMLKNNPLKLKVRVGGPRSYNQESDNNPGRTSLLIRTRFFFR